MLRISDFSKLSRVSAKALRYYDELGLLRPERVDPDTGYRLYSVTQLPRLNRILALKDLGFSLDQVARLLEEELPPAELRGMLRLKQAETRRHIDAELARLDRIEGRLRQIEQEETASPYEVVLKSVDAQRVASVRDRLQAFPEVGRLFDELRAYRRRHGIRTTTWTAIRHDYDPGDEDVDGEATMATDDPLPADGRVRESALPAVAAMACVVHHGPFDSMRQAYTALITWIETGGYRITGPSRELYYRGGNDQHDASFVTEIQFPVEKA